MEPIIKISQSAPYTVPPSEDELAAIVAAIRVYIEQPEVARKEATSVWGRVARLEAVGTVSDTRKAGGRLWSLVLALAVSVNAAMAQTSIASVPPRPMLSQGKTIRVLLATGPRMELDFPDGASIYTLADGALVGRINPLSSWSMTLAASRPALQLVARNSASKFDATANNFVSAAFTPRTASPQVDRYCFPLTASALPDSDALDASAGYLLVAGRAEADTARSNKDVALFALGGKLYRGALILRPTANNGISAINVLDLEDYLLSVVPSEVPSLWPAEVLKAQAVAARSYAVANLGKHRAEGYDVKATVDDQVYRGVVAEADETALTDHIVKFKQNFFKP